ncbi:MAG: ABC transporter substrate-binding protein [Bacillota bacterium]
MVSKNITFLLIMSIFLTLFFACNVMAQENEFVDPDIPESWYEAPKTASDMGIKEFDQSPMLDQRVEEGELPPVEERLPEDPIVVEPYKEVGEYGGTLITWGRNRDLSNFWGNLGELNDEPMAGRSTPDGSEVFPSYFKDWEYSEDADELTIYFREGMKWSDGEEFTADDYVYWYKHVAQNEDLNPVSPEDFSPPLIDVVKENDYALTLKFGESFPRFHEFNFTGNLSYSVHSSPEHVMKEFHPDFVEKEELIKLAEDVDLDSWYEYYQRVQNSSPMNPDYENRRPTLRPYLATERSESHMVLERNPYYPFVDTEGNQLPYIDKIRINLTNEREMAATKAATGESDFEASNTVTSDIPLYKKNQENENYSTLVYIRPFGAEVAIQPNLSHPDEKLREIFLNDKFRKALSLSIDRENINNKIYFGLAKPMQSTVPPLNKYYKPEYGEAYAEYDPERAKKLLDEIGMVEEDENGFRQTPDGEKFNPTLIYSEAGPVEPTSIFELVRSNWEDIGLDIDFKNVSIELKETQWSGNEGDMSYWTNDVVLDITFGHPIHAGKSFAPTGGAPQSPWPAYVNWVTTDGEEGIEPPENIMKLLDYQKNLLSSPDPEERDQAAVNLIEAQADNLWTIGTVGMAPQPLIISNRLKNVPKKGIWDFGPRNMNPYMPDQFYLEE